MQYYIQSWYPTHFDFFLSPTKTKKEKFATMQLQEYLDKKTKSLNLTTQIGKKETHLSFKQFRF